MFNRNIICFSTYILPSVYTTYYIADVSGKMFVCVSDKTDENGAVVGIAWDSSYLKTILGRLTLGAIVSLHKYCSKNQTISG